MARSKLCTNGRAVVTSYISQGRSLPKQVIKAVSQKRVQALESGVFLTEYIFTWPLGSGPGPVQAGAFLLNPRVALTYGQTRGAESTHVSIKSGRNGTQAFALAAKTTGEAFLILIPRLLRLDQDFSRLKEESKWDALLFILCGIWGSASSSHVSSPVRLD